MDQHMMCTCEPIVQINNEHVWLPYSFPTQSSLVARPCLRGGACLYNLTLHIVRHWFCWSMGSYYRRTVTVEGYYSRNVTTNPKCREGLSKLTCITLGTNLCSSCWLQGNSGSFITTSTVGVTFAAVFLP